MAAADEHRAGCDGCNRTVPLDELTAVTMPGGDRVACCPRCLPHAREAARKRDSLDQRRTACDGCNRTVLETDLEDVVLDDGIVLSCCRKCVTEAPETTDRSTTAASATESVGSSETDAPKTATDEHARCTQCTESVGVELFHVTTVDERTERLCPDCKANAEENGVVADVKMRKTEARDVLGVEPGATDGELREAFHRQVKRAHPDRKSGSRSAFKLVRDAYERLRESQ